MLNLRGIDLNLLPVFEAAYEEGSLSKAAHRLSVTQPAVSHALSRLRVAFRDELFVRHSRGVRPTQVADAIYARLGGALALVREAVTESRERLIEEAADVLYHLLVVLKARDIKLAEVETVLGARTSQSGFAEKTSRKGG